MSRAHWSIGITGILAMAAVWMGACGGGGSSGSSQPDASFSRPAGWTEETHGKNATPNYAAVFPSEGVPRIDIAIAPADWQAMQDDMAGMLGVFGSGQHGGGGPMPGNDGGMPPVPGDGGMGPPPGDGGMPPMPGDGGMGPPPGDGGMPPPMPGDAGMKRLADDAGSPQPPDGGMPPMPGDAGMPGPNDDGGMPPMPGDSGMPGPRDDGGMPPMPGDGGMPDPGTQGDDMNNLVPNQPIYVPCTVTFNGLTWQYAGVRYKGNSSLANPWSSGIAKLPLRLDFDRFEDQHPEIKGQRFYGFEGLSFGNNANDQSELRDKVAGDIYREAGLPTARSTFYRVYVDHGSGPIYFGLYTVVEVPDKPMLDDQFGDASGNLYKPEGDGARWTAFDEASFEKETNKSADDWSDVKEAIASLNAATRTQDPAAWRAGLEATFDVDGFLRWLAVNTLIVNWDTYGLMTHNYYLYGDPDDGGRLHWIPWDHNEALSADNRSLSLGLSEVNESWPLIRFLMDDPVYQARYLALLRETANGVFSVEHTTARFNAEYQRIAPYVVGPEGEQQEYTFVGSQQSFDSALQGLFEHVRTRLAALEQFLGNP